MNQHLGLGSAGPIALLYFPEHIYTVAVRWRISWRLVILDGLMNSLLAFGKLLIRGSVALVCLMIGLMSAGVMPTCLSSSSSSFTWWWKRKLFKLLLTLCLLVSHWPRKTKLLSRGGEIKNSFWWEEHQRICGHFLHLNKILITFFKNFHVWL